MGEQQRPDQGESNRGEANGCDEKVMTPGDSTTEKFDQTTREVIENVKRYDRSSLINFGKNLKSGANSRDFLSRLQSFEKADWARDDELFKPPKLVRSATTLRRQNSDLKRCTGNLRPGEKQQNDLKCKPSTDQSNTRSSNNANGTKLMRMVSSPQIKWTKAKNLPHLSELPEQPSKLRRQKTLDCGQGESLKRPPHSCSSDRRISLDIGNQKTNTKFVTNNIKSGHQRFGTQALGLPNPDDYESLPPISNINLTTSVKYPKENSLKKLEDLMLSPVVKIEARTHTEPNESTYENAAAKETDHFDITNLLSLTVFSDTSSVCQQGPATRTINSKQPTSSQKNARKTLRKLSRSKTMNQFHYMGKQHRELTITSTHLDADNLSHHETGFVYDNEPLSLDYSDVDLHTPFVNLSQINDFSQDPRTFEEPVSMPWSYRCISQQEAMSWSPKLPIYNRSHRDDQKETTDIPVDESVSQIIETFKAQVKARALAAEDIKEHSGGDTNLPMNSLKEKNNDHEDTKSKKTDNSNEIAFDGKIKLSQTISRDVSKECTLSYLADDHKAAGIQDKNSISKLPRLINTKAMRTPLKMTDQTNSTSKSKLPTIMNKRDNDDKRHSHIPIKLSAMKRQKSLLGSIRLN